MNLPILRDQSARAGGVPFAGIGALRRLELRWTIIDQCNNADTRKAAKQKLTQLLAPTRRYSITSKALVRKLPCAGRSRPLPQTTMGHLGREWPISHLRVA